MAGRFGWSSTSDLIGRKPMYMVYLGVGIVLYALLATVGHTATALFVLAGRVILSFYGGGSRRYRRTCATCSAPTRSGPSTAACSPPGRPPAWPDR